MFWKDWELWELIQAGVFGRSVSCAHWDMAASNFTACFCCCQAAMVASVSTNAAVKPNLKLRRSECSLLCVHIGDWCNLPFLYNYTILFYAALYYTTHLKIYIFTVKYIIRVYWNSLLKSFYPKFWVEYYLVIWLACSYITSEK